jgi:hypothetical protein
MYVFMSVYFVSQKKYSGVACSLLRERREGVLDHESVSGSPQTHAGYGAPAVVEAIRPGYSNKFGLCTSLVGNSDRTY